MKESKIRPHCILDEFLRLCELDSKIYFGDAELMHISCPACGADGIDSFTKYGFSYQECPVCQTLYVNPRPLSETFFRFYQESESARYFATTFYKVTAEARREKLWRPKAQMVLEFIEKYGTKQDTLIDIGGGYGIFAEEYEKISDNKVTVIEPALALAKVCRDKGIRVVEEFFEDLRPEQLSAPPRAFVCFELFEHLHNPEKFLRHLRNLMSTGEIFVFTTLSGVGVGIQAFWEDSKSISPPHHLNFLNPKSVRILLERVGFEILQRRTPGKLDIDILCNNKQFIKDRFWRTFVIQASKNEKQDMQKFIANNGWSSHMLVVCQKP